jgi:hypothetical protein
MIYRHFAECKKYDCVEEAMIFSGTLALVVR